MAVIPVTVSAKEAQIAIDEALEKVDKQLRELNQFVRHRLLYNDGFWLTGSDLVKPRTGI